MAHDYEAVFESGDGALGPFFAGLPAVLEAHRLAYGGEVYALERARDGTHHVADLATVAVPAIEDVGVCARRWDGVSVGLVSSALFDVLGRSDAVEVDLRVCYRRGRGVSLSYREGGGAWRARRQRADLQRGLCSLLLALASLAGSRRAIYDEETAMLTAGGVAAAQGTILDTGRFPSGGADGVLIVPSGEAGEALARLSAPASRLLGTRDGASVLNLL